MAESLSKCSGCGTTLRLKSALPPGKAIRCPKCATIVRGPAAPTASVTPVPEPPLAAPEEAGNPSEAPASPGQSWANSETVSVAGLFAGIGAFLVVHTAIILLQGHEQYGRGPNLIVRDAERQERFLTMFLMVLGFGVALMAYAPLLLLRRRWIVYLGFPLVVMATLAVALAQFALNAHIVLILVVALAGMGLGMGLVTLLAVERSADAETEYRALRGPDADPIPALATLLRHPKAHVRRRAIHEAASLGPAAAGLVPVLAEIVRTAVPPPSDRKNVCSTCNRPLSVWTKDRITSNVHPEGFAVCMTCRNELRDGVPSEAQIAVDALLAIGSPARAAAPSLRAASQSYDPKLQAACVSALEILAGKTESKPK